MTCEMAREQIAARWVESLPEEVQKGLEAHLVACPACREHAESLDALWADLARLPEPEPGPPVTARFRRMVEVYQLGAASIGAQSEHRGAPRYRPLLQFAAAAALVVVGVAAGHFYTARNHDLERIATLTADVQQMRQLVAVSLLRQPSAVERLRGVGYSREMDAANGEVTEALFQALNHDSSVNVRLSAIDALRQASSQQVELRGEAIRRLRQAILSQDSPLVQMALIDWAVEAQDRESLRALSRLGRGKLDPAVSVRLAGALDRVQ